MAPYSSTLAWKIPWTEEPGRLQSMGSLSRTRLSDFTFTFPFHALEKEMATHSSVLAWRIPGTGEPGEPPSMGSHRVGHDWSDLAAAALQSVGKLFPLHITLMFERCLSFGATTKLPVSPLVFNLSLCTVSPKTVRRVLAQGSAAVQCPMLDCTNGFRGINLFHPHNVPVSRYCFWPHL